MLGRLLALVAHASTYCTVDGEDAPYNGPLSLSPLCDLSIWILLFTAADVDRQRHAPVETIMNEKKKRKRI